jgi:NitT/TauT family transport system ATP-binding protein
MTAATTPKLRIEHVSVTFPLGRGVVRALDDVSLTIAEGEFCAVVGPSGCGKSTLLRAVAGLNLPAQGKITIVPAQSKAKAERATPLQAMVFQGRSIFPWQTVLHNAAYGLAMQGMPRLEREEIAERWLRQVGLGEFMQAYPAQLSEGMRQRVAIVRAFAVNPEVLLMDEPFGALDEQTRLILQDELLRLWETTGKTVLFVTHSIDEAMILADRIVVMSARPGTLKADVRVPFPRPRSVEAVRSEPVFSELFLHIWGLLRDEAALAARVGA